MKNLVKIAICTVFSVLAACKHENDLDNKVPNCITDKVEALKELPPQNPRAEVWQWDVDGKIYYYITSDCCDQFNYLYDNQCNVVCAPDGGITGGGDGTCPKFTGKIDSTLIWKDPRE
ncbi:MAG: hypothetical protein NW218_14805 [Saprospiraceae bacterium]|nr:hypothetical protein [Saprospiraceae bacterium]